MYLLKKSFQQENYLLISSGTIKDGFIITISNGTSIWKSTITYAQRPNNRSRESESVYMNALFSILSTDSPEDIIHTRYIFDFLPQGTSLTLVIKELIPGTSTMLVFYRGEFILQSSFVDAFNLLLEDIFQHSKVVQQELQEYKLKHSLLMTNNEELSKDIIKLQNMKDTLQDTMIQQFCIILNQKKREILSLQDQLTKLQGSNNLKHLPIEEEEEDSEEKEIPKKAISKRKQPTSSSIKATTSKTSIKKSSTKEKEIIKSTRGRKPAVKRRKLSSSSSDDDDDDDDDDEDDLEDLIDDNDEEEVDDEEEEEDDNRSESEVDHSDEMSEISTRRQPKAKQTTNKSNTKTTIKKLSSSTSTQDIKTSQESVLSSTPAIIPTIQPIKQLDSSDEEEILTTSRRKIHITQQTSSINPLPPSTTQTNTSSSLFEPPKPMLPITNPMSSSSTIIANDITQSLNEGIKASTATTTNNTTSKLLTGKKKSDRFFEDDSDNDNGCLSFI